MAVIKYSNAKQSDLLTLYNQGTTEAMQDDHVPSEFVHIMCAADVRYGPFAGIVMSSVLRSTKRSKIHFHLLSDGVARQDINKMRDQAKRHGGIISVHDVAKKLSSLPNDVHMANHISRSSFSRIFFAGIVPDSVSKIIYLDCDVICQEDITDLWNNISDQGIIYAARDPWLNRDSKLKESLGMGSSDQYFNAGVLAINVDQWRARNTENHLLSFIAANPHVANADQDMLNAVLFRDVRLLDEKWNTMIDLPNISMEEEARTSAAIIHYVGGFKPWHFGYALLRSKKSKPFNIAKNESSWRMMLPDFHAKRITKKIYKIAARMRS